jgi:hypothetical protein
VPQAYFCHSPWEWCQILGSAECSMKYNMAYTFSELAHVYLLLGGTWGNTFGARWQYAELHGMFNWNPFVALLWQYRCHNCAYDSVNILADTCLEEYRWLGEQLMQTTLQCSIKIEYHVVNMSKQDQRAVKSPMPSSCCMITPVPCSPQSSGQTECHAQTFCIQHGLTTMQFSCLQTIKESPQSHTFT